jgi:hypothetical protein
VDCPVAFACEHPETGEPIIVPFCSYFLFKNDILRKAADRWSKKTADADKRTPNTQPPGRLETVGSAAANAAG